MSIKVLILLGAGLFIQIPSISAQEALPQENLEQDALFSGEGTVDRLRAAEMDMVFPDAVSPGMTSGPSIWDAFRMILILGLAAAAIYGVVYFIKRSSKPAVAADPFLKILASAHLGSNRYAHIISAGGKAWLLGSSDGGVNLIGEVDDKDTINAMLLEESRKSTEENKSRFPDFMSILRRMGTQAEKNTPGAEDLRKRRERLKGL